MTEETSDDDSNEEVTTNLVNSDVKVDEADKSEELDNVVNQDVEETLKTEEEAGETVEESEALTEETNAEEHEEEVEKVETLVVEQPETLVTEQPIVEFKTVTVEETKVELDEDESVVEFEDGDPLDVVYDSVVADFGMKRSALRMMKASAETTMTSKEFDAIWDNAVECGETPEPFCVF
jgi:hypothetical protein